MDDSALDALLTALESLLGTSFGSGRDVWSVTATATDSNLTAGGDITVSAKTAELVNATVSNASEAAVTAFAFTVSGAAGLTMATNKVLSEARATVASTGSVRSSCRPAATSRSRPTTTRRSSPTSARLLVDHDERRRRALPRRRRGIPCRRRPRDGRRRRRPPPVRRPRAALRRLRLGRLHRRDVTRRPGRDDPDETASWSNSATATEKPASRRHRACGSSRTAMSSTSRAITTAPATER